MKFKKSVTVSILLILIVSLVSVILVERNYNDSSTNKESLYRNWLVANVDNNFRFELSSYINEYKTILDEAENNDKSEDKQNYLVGRIDGFLSRNTSPIISLLTMENLDQEISNEVINPSIVQPLTDFISASTKYIKTLKEDIENNQLHTDKLVQLNSLFINLRLHGSEMLTSSPEYTEFLKNIQKIVQVMNSES
ncbi:hypothetical protein [Paenibacillus sp. HB172176]|uniref:hypothetical protein n=1 Tax=Paenibacillus sp. HB172176 TaxID=2493690 RepID=UPI00143C47E3|nr:hypothetical protein [Paenibacillus sp. HB172176]